MRRALAWCAVWSFSTAAIAATAARPAANDYGLSPVRLADGVSVFVGRNEGFTRDNGGDIVNTGFLVGSSGVIVIDSGPSRAYGEQQRAAIAKVTALPVVQVYDTHAHPDHFLGNQAYPASLTGALPGTIAAIQRSGDALSGNLYRLVGGWMIDTRVVVPEQAVAPGTVTIGGRQIQLIAGAGHTDDDLLVFDLASRTLFAGDLVFHDRAPTTPNADLPHWLAQLDAIDRIDYRILVPGHGTIVRDRSAVAQTRDYLHWLSDSLHAAAAKGMDMEEVMHLPVPERFRGLAEIDNEYRRSVSHLYPKIELDSLPPARAERGGVRR